MELNELINTEAALGASVDQIVQKVLEKLGRTAKSAMICFSGAGIGSTEAFAGLSALKKEGWSFQAFMSDGALQAFDPEDIKRILGVNTVETNAEHQPLRKMIQDVDEIILATSTVNTVAKLAAGICDTPMLTMLGQGLMMGKHIICVVDGACPDNKTRATLGMGKAPEAYRQVLRNNLETLSSFGISLVAADELLFACSDIPLTKDDGSRKKRIQSAVPAEIAACTPKPAGGCVIEKHIISRTDICKCRGQQKIIITDDAIVTGFAQDAAKEYGITIERV